MQQLTLYPSQALRQYISHYVIFQNIGDSALTMRDYPRTAMDMIFIFDGGIEIQNQGDSFALEKCSFVSLFNTPYDIKLSQQIHAIHIRFKPSGIYALSHLPLKEVLNGQVAIDQLMNQNTSEIFHKMGELSDPKLQIDLFESWVLEAYRNSDQHFRFEYGLKLIEETQGNLSVKDLSMKLNSNYKSLDRWFNKLLGMNPKQYIQITRFKNILEAIEQRAESDWMEIVTEFNFYDQAHFSNSFKKYAQISPEQYRSSLLNT